MTYACLFYNVNHPFKNWDSPEARKNIVIKYISVLRKIKSTIDMFNSYIFNWQLV